MTNIPTSTFEVLRQRLEGQASDLSSRIAKLNEARQATFGAQEHKLLANDRITTENNCIPRDMTPLGDHFLFGYNVQIGLRSSLELSDVFAAYRYDPSDHSLHAASLDLLDDTQFDEDFHNLYRYYKNTTFAKFHRKGAHLYLVFQVGKKATDIKAFKFVVRENSLQYEGNRFDHEVTFPPKHEFRLTRTNRDMQRREPFSMLSLADRVFVSIREGRLEFRIEDNTPAGKVILTEKLDHADQTLDDISCAFSEIGEVMVISLLPYQEEVERWYVVNVKRGNIHRNDALGESAVMLPDQHGIIFPQGYYLETDIAKVFDHGHSDFRFEKRINAPNGEDSLFVFYQAEEGLYLLLSYNIVTQQTLTPVLCHGYSIFPDGELIYFRAEDTPGKHHVVQIWQSAYSETAKAPNGKANSYLSKVGNKDLVRGIAECQELLTLIHQEKGYADLYVDIVRRANATLDSFYWIDNDSANNLAEPLKAISESASAAIDTYARVRRLQQEADEQQSAFGEEADKIRERIRRRKPQSVNDYVAYLAELRKLQGKASDLKGMAYVEVEEIEQTEAVLVETRDQLSRDCVRFLLRKDALAPYEQKIAEGEEAVKNFKTVVEGDALAESFQELGSELELLIQTVSNLPIADANQTTEIIDRISTLFAQLNQLRAQQKQRRDSLRKHEAEAEFAAQLRLTAQALANYLDLSNTPDDCERYLGQYMLQIEELEAKFGDFPAFSEALAEQRESGYNTFEARRLQLTEQRQRRASNLTQTAKRLLQTIEKRAIRIDDAEAHSAYFAADLMVDKVRQTAKQLREMGEAVRAGELETQLQQIQENSLTKLHDREELGDEHVKFGRHTFAAHKQELGLSLTPKDGQMCIHLSGTSFFQPVHDQAIDAAEDLWEQALVSENDKVYRAEYLAYTLIQNSEFTIQNSQLASAIQSRPQEGYVKGVHDEDASRILEAVTTKAQELGSLRFAPEVRVLGRFCYDYLFDEAQKREAQLDAATSLKGFADSSAQYDWLIDEIAADIISVAGTMFLGVSEERAAQYLFEVITSGKTHRISRAAGELHEAFQAFLKRKKAKTAFADSLTSLSDPGQRFAQIRVWVDLFLHDDSSPEVPQVQAYGTELAYILLSDSFDKKQVSEVSDMIELDGLNGSHPLIEDGRYAVNYHAFMARLEAFAHHDVPRYEAFLKRRHELIQQAEKQLKPERFKARPMPGFVRNRLIDRVYLPLIGENLAKQIGAEGDNQRADRQGMLLLISPPGYGKTTLMEYVADRLGLFFAKINGPSLGHEITSLDPAAAPNSAAREELIRLNLALAMGDNVMLYLDDIQHCHPEFLQKFIPLADGNRKIEGVWDGEAQTFNMRSRRFCVVMAGNPYTESGDQFQIPDMLANRADTYNLGDILGDHKADFELSYIENVITTQPSLRQLRNRPKDDLYAIINSVRNGNMESMELSEPLQPDAQADIQALLSMLFRVQEVVLKVNQQYIASAAQADEYRTEPAFRLQGSYRNMSRLAAQLDPIMNDEEVESLLLSHYSQESQTLTNEAEANLLKFKAMVDQLSESDAQRWEKIVETFRRNKLMQTDRLGQMAQHLEALVEEMKKFRSEGMKEN